MPILKFSTKGQTLEDLSRVITTAKVLPLIRFTVDSFINHSEIVLQQIQSAFTEPQLIIRSSAHNEDALHESKAGHYKSILNVPKNDKKRLCDAIEQVIASYDTGELQNEVLVQPILTSIQLSGVVFTADLDTLAPYYIVNYDESGNSDAVTSGRELHTKTFIQFKSLFSPDLPSYLLSILHTCQELEKLFAYPYLDIEFAFDNAGKLYIFQVRPIATEHKERLDYLDFDEVLLKIHKKVEKLSFPHPNLLGHKTLFGIMPDWNPAEMIGLRPRQLSLSLYKELITDNIWAYQRDNYGYKNLRSHPLMISLLGIPFIDLRVDFNSFIPKELNPRIAEKLVNYYLTKLSAIPTLHDKIEFEVVFSCYSFDLPHRLRELLDYGFNNNEIKRIEFALLAVTNNIIDPQLGLYQGDLKRIEQLKDKYTLIVNSHLPLIEKIYWLVEDCKRYGTLPFAGIARAAFIAVQLLRSFVNIEILTSVEYEQFMNSLNTVAKHLNQTLYQLAHGQCSKAEFLSQFGHLRPGTYDILSWRYDENFEHYFTSPVMSHAENSSFTFTPEKISQINLALLENGFKIDAENLIFFIKEAIEGREYAKFIFTRSVSEVLRLIQELGEKYGVSREDLANVDIKNLLHLYSSLDHRNVKDTLSADIAVNKTLYQYTKAIKLPALIKNANEVYGFALEQEEPNFVTLKRVQALTLREAEFHTENFQNSIVLIRSADPGYDFLFTKQIGGLITQFGGANSHMAIRCAELGIPAVIGAGEKRFNEWSRARKLEIDGLNKQVRVVAT